jgi:hypothetical protein
MWQSNLNSEWSGMLEEAFVTGIFWEKLRGRQSQRQPECLSLSKTQTGYVWNVCQSVWAEVVSVSCNRGSNPRSHWRGFSTASRPTQHPLHWQLLVLPIEVKRQGNEVDYFFTIKTNRRTNFQILFLYLTCFGQFLCPSSGVVDCTFGTGTCYTGLTTASVQDQDGTPWSF